MAKQTIYEAVVVYPAEPISILDRNLARIAKNYDGSVCGDSFEQGKGRWHRRIAYSFASKPRRLRFIAAVQKFLGSASFGVSVTVTAEGKEKS